MKLEDVSLFVRFNYWANDHILEACRSLTAEQFVAPLSPDPGRGSLRGILVHALDTEFGWRASMQPGVADVLIKPEDFPDVPALIARWEREKADWFAYLESLTDEALQAGFGEEPEKSPRVWQTIMHVVAHGIQHRSEAAAILTGYGYSPGELDLIYYLISIGEVG